MYTLHIFILSFTFFLFLTLASIEPTEISFAIVSVLSDSVLYIIHAADLRNSTANSILYLLLLALIHAFISAKALTRKHRKYIFLKIICVIKLTIILMHHWYFRFYYLLPDFQLIFRVMHGIHKLLSFADFFSSSLLCAWIWCKIMKWCSNKLLSIKLKYFKMSSVRYRNAVPCFAKWYFVVNADLNEKK